MGVGRMLAGAHWLSDVIWGALSPWLVVWLLDYVVLKMRCAEVTLRVDPAALVPVVLLARVRGFGLPGNKAVANCSVHQTAQLTFRDRQPPASSRRVNCLLHANKSLIWAAVSRSTVSCFM
jgi:hypothetical protein